jgi:pimeloyl-ACP methyl ester carboxylesterase
LYRSKGQGMDIQRITAGVLEVAYLDLGPADGPVAILLHGFPYDALSCIPAAERLAARGVRVIVPWLRGYGPTRFLSDTTLRSGQQAVLATDLVALMDALGIRRAVLGGYDWGGRAACIVAALWPDRVAGLVSAGLAYNIQDIAASARPAAPEQEARFWYQYYFHGARGAAGLAANRHDLCRLLWRMWSPTWDFDAATYAASAAAFDNPDFVAVVIHSYRHRFALVAGDPAAEPVEAALAAQPAITVPSVVLLGADDDVSTPADSDPKRGKFTDLKAWQVLPGIGHNVPQEAPGAFAVAIHALVAR